MTMNDIVWFAVIWGRNWSLKPNVPIWEIARQSPGKPRVTCVITEAGDRYWLNCPPEMGPPRSAWPRVA